MNLKFLLAFLVLAVIAHETVGICNFCLKFRQLRKTTPTPRPRCRFCHEVHEMLKTSRRVKYTTTQHPLRRIKMLSHVNVIYHHHNQGWHNLPRTPCKLCHHGHHGLLTTRPPCRFCHHGHHGWPITRPPCRFCHHGHHGWPITRPPCRFCHHGHHGLFTTRPPCRLCGHHGYLIHH